MYTYIIVFFFSPRQTSVDHIYAVGDVIDR